MINYTLKSAILETEYNGQLLVEIERKIHLALNFPDSPYTMSVEIALELYAELLEYFGADIMNECRKINKAFCERTKRLKEKITIMQENDCLFLTMTFTDYVLSTTQPKTRKTYITRFLKQFGVPYIANIDFGKKKGREHYHGLIQIDYIDPHLYPYGNIDIQRYRKSTNGVKIAKYISKLCNHAIKETTKRNAIIYSR